MNYLELKKDFDNLNPEEQWAWANKYKSEITLDLDNDNTTFTFNKEDKSEDCTLFSFKSDIGNRLGVPMLLSAVGFTGYNV